MSATPRFLRSVRPWGMVAALGMLFTVLPAAAEDAAPPADDVARRLEKLEQDNKRLQEKLGEVEKKVAPPKKDGDEKKAPEFHEVGSDLKFSARWNDGLWLETAQQDFKIHIGGRFDYDSVWWSPDAAMNAPTNPVVVPGTGLGRGVAPLDDGFFFRRVRSVIEGTIYETAEFAFEVDFENGNQLAFDDVWFGMKELPWLNRVRIGQQKVPQGLESYSSSRFLPMLERSLLFEAFWQEFALGVSATNSYCDDRVTSAFMFSRMEAFNTNFGAQFGDGTYAYTGRLTGLAWYENEGRCLLHLGASAQYRVADYARTANQTLPPLPPGVTDPKIVRYRTRPEIRDNGEALGDSTRFVDTGPIIAAGSGNVSPELLWIQGPFSLQAEATWVTAVDSVWPVGVTQRSVGNQSFWGGYVLFSYLLTGENRGYDRKLGRYDRVRPIENFFLVKGEDGKKCYGLGAWEVNYRYSYVDLNSDPVTGGQMTGHTFGLTWFLNANTKVQANYLLTSRNVPQPANSGDVNAFGLRVHIDY